jgi:putative endonuclease
VSTWGESLSMQRADVSALAEVVSLGRADLSVRADDTATLRNHVAARREDVDEWREDGSVGPATPSRPRAVPRRPLGVRRGPLHSRPPADSTGPLGTKVAPLPATLAASDLTCELFNGMSIRPRLALERGRRAESVVTDYLVAQGHTILERNLRLGSLELDIVTRQGPLVCVVEVRTRGKGSFLPALATISTTKRKHLLRAAECLWQQRFAYAPGVDRLRIDVAAVYFDEGAPRVEYFAGAVTGTPKT